ncbi:TetR/AcrR family transcriptional regulator [Bacterioplanes sanyensis]|nr:TetR/AcrR family transcriptional regulator [Bacterioplanes sanyensis]
MPKIIDHDSYRAELALQAAEVFLQHGYRQLGMRQLAEQLGVSKSKLYHYFASKEALFSAATEAIIAADAREFASPQQQSNQADPGQQVERLIELIHAWLPRFRAELQLTLDYTEVIGGAAIATDSVMRLSQNNYRSLFAGIVGTELADATYSAVMGILCNRLLSGELCCSDSDRQLLGALVMSDR